ncbi:DNA gyrase inhibitor YacG [hydrothermal vent metagenome]|uniref:DNA gyrase inhibitor YacG n=1 Tax=hydrothermal vent metagenome TaxID=652676 RepID=A0A3B1B214_9ZZZZ
MTTKVKCPTCQKLVSWIKENKHRPFCSERCQLIDLGEWASDNRKICEPR